MQLLFAQGHPGSPNKIVDQLDRLQQTRPPGQTTCGQLPEIAARRVRSRLPPPPPSPADARTPGSLGGGPKFFLWMPGDFDGRGRGAEKTRHVWSEVAPVCGRSSRGPVSVVRVGRT